MPFISFTADFFNSEKHASYFTMESYKKIRLIKLYFADLLSSLYSSVKIILYLTSFKS